MDCLDSPSSKYKTTFLFCKGYGKPCFLTTYFGCIKFQCLLFSYLLLKSLNDVSISPSDDSVSSPLLIRSVCSIAKSLSSKNVLSLTTFNSLRWEDVNSVFNNSFSYNTGAKNQGRSTFGLFVPPTAEKNPKKPDLIYRCEDWYINDLKRSKSNKTRGNGTNQKSNV